MFKPRHFMQAALVTLAVSGCGGNRNEAPAPGPENYAVLKVDNQSTRDVRIYVRPGGGAGRFRLGIANALSTTMLQIPRTMATGVTDLTFEIAPIGGGGSAFSERVTAHPDEEILLRIPPS